MEVLFCSSQDIVLFHVLMKCCCGVQFFFPLNLPLASVSVLLSMQSRGPQRVPMWSVWTKATRLSCGLNFDWMEGERQSSRASVCGGAGPWLNRMETPAQIHPEREY